ncbi:MAG: creatininase family protein [Nitrososphaerota archaeon]|jgi:creatinine amidohydrolase|nr:creatininase family protein [Nitrososphaerota archaeon]
MTDNINAVDASQLLWLDELSTIEVAKIVKQGIVIILPIGSVEEHGEHLPLCTDSIQPEYVALEVARQTGCKVAPPFRYGIVNAGRNFSGSITLQFNTLFNVVKDILSELTRNGFNRIIVLSGHAGSSHMVALKLAAQQVIQQNGEKNGKQTTRIMVLSDYDFAEELNKELADPNDGHAGTIETARVMDIRPDLIKTKGIPSHYKMPRFEIVLHPEHYFPSGVHGDPTTATAKKGQKINNHVITQVIKLVQELQT